MLPGRLFLSASHLRFVGSSGPAGEGCGQLLEGDWSGAISKDSALLWPLAAVKQMHRRRCMMAHTAIELFRDDGDSLLFNLPDRVLRSRVRRWIKRKCTLEYRNRDYHRGGFRQMLFELQEQWQRREVSNFEYLMRLNQLAGRTHADLNQYPVFPWVLADYESATLNLADPASFRDLSRPMGAQAGAHVHTCRLRSDLYARMMPMCMRTHKCMACACARTDARARAWACAYVQVEAQRQLVQRSYEEYDDPYVPKFHYGSHYSTMGFVLYYLVRVEPFSSYHTALQSGRFDHADRLFHSIRRTYHSCTHSSSDVKARRSPRMA